MRWSQGRVDAQGARVVGGCSDAPEVRYPRAEGLRPVGGREVEDDLAWETVLRGAEPLHNLRLQGLDLREHRDLLLGRDDLSDLVVLGGTLDEEIEQHLRRHGAIIFPADPRAPVDPYRARLYTPQELYAGMDEAGYVGTVDARAYAWSQDAALQHDAYVSALRAIHDDAMTDALAAVVEGREVVGVMGGHALRRGSDDYASAALLGHRLAQSGALVVTGGGPGAMEAANLGAWAPDHDTLAATLGQVAAVPDFAADIAAWAAPALRARLELGPPQPQRVRSVGIPTWYYGHEPPNAFGQLVAKFFSNALREDLLLAHSRAGLVVLPGAAGTVQEIFQMATRLYYGVDERAAPLVLVGVEHWTTHLPVWPLLRALGRWRPMDGSLHLVGTVDEAAAVLAAG
ncbi:MULTISPECIES: LOG family protein [unclassified Ornithinimicrobium]|uniref:LOG family protein n=1 Tax=unclassified Ornithinimicrobium TaxID=2615080 RepID=UPI003851DC14